MKVKVWVRVNSPYWFFDKVETSTEMTSPDSSLVFTCLEFFNSNALHTSDRQNHTLPSFSITLSSPKELLLKIWILFIVVSSFYDILPRWEYVTISPYRLKKNHLIFISKVKKSKILAKTKHVSSLFFQKMSGCVSKNHFSFSHFSR